MAKCPQCNDKELVGKQKYCSGACKMKASRTKKLAEAPTYLGKEMPVTVKQEAPPVVVPKEESYHDRLIRRQQETGSKELISIRIGYPPEPAPGILVPSKYEDQDLKAARAEITRTVGPIKGVPVGTRAIFEHRKPI